MTRRLDDLIVAATALAIVVLCLAFRYLPMTDLPQHYAMVSIIANHGDDSYGFGDRYTFDFLGRPYATVYLFGAGLAKLVSIDTAMHIVVALCTVAPLIGVYLLLAAAGRPRVWALLVVPFCFGHMWHFGFLNFLMGAGLQMGALALVVAAVRSPGRRGYAIGLGLTAVALAFTHAHAFAAFALIAPLIAWAFRPDGAHWRAAARALAPAIPAAVLFVVSFILVLGEAQGHGSMWFPGPIERIERVPQYLSAGMANPWPQVSVALFVAAVAGAFVIGERGLGRPGRALLAAAGVHLVLFFVLPLQTSSTNYLNPREIVLAVLALCAALPMLSGWRHDVARGLCAVVAVVSLVWAVSSLSRFNTDAVSYDAIEAQIPPNQKVAALIFAPRSRHLHNMAAPYLQFTAYYQARHGGDVSFSFAQHWNIPVRYRDDYSRPELPSGIEWQPQAFPPSAAPFFDYFLVRSDEPIQPPSGSGLIIVGRSGPWMLLRHGP